MSVTIRIPRRFHERLVLDLERRHEFAYERVGWIYARQANIGNDHILLIPTEYEGVLDENYVENEGVGACFNAAAIRTALQRARSTKLTCLQVHLHNQNGETDFSSIDCRTIDGTRRTRRCKLVS